MTGVVDQLFAKLEVNYGTEYLGYSFLSFFIDRFLNINGVIKSLVALTRCMFLRLPLF